MLHNWIEHARPGLAAVLLVLAGCAGSPERVAQDAADGELEPAYPPAALEDYAYALGLMDNGQAAQAAERLRRLAAEYPDYAGPVTNLAILAAANGDDAAALAHLERAVEICTTCAPAWNQLGILHRRAGRFDQAEVAYRAAVDSDPEYALAHYNLGVLYDLYRQRHELAVEHYERYVALSADAENTELVGKWIADLRRRLGESPRTARAGGEL